MKTISVANLTPHPRHEIVRATVPLTSSETELPNHVVGQPASFEPFGLPYRNNKPRMLELYTKVQLEPWETKMLEVVRVVEPPAAIPWHWGPGLLTGGYQMSLHVRIGDKWHEHAFNALEHTTPSNPFVHTIASISRVAGTPFVACLWLYLGSGSDVNRWELMLFASDPSVPDMTHQVGEVRLLFGGRALGVVHHYQARGVEMLRPWQEWTLLGETHFGDGQGQMWHGELITVLPTDQEQLLTAAAARDWPLWGVSEDWMVAREAYGALQWIPSPMADSADGGDEMVTQQFRRLHTELQRFGDWWDEHPLGLTKTPSQTGGQSDFGMCAAWDLLFTGRCELLEGYYFAAQEDAKRPSYYFEQDGKPINPVNHPLWRPWNGRTFIPSISPDQLGKNQSLPFDTHGWRAKDHEHWSSNLLYTAAMLTGSKALQFLARREVVLLNAARTTHSTHGGWPTSNGSWSRRDGRPMLALMTLELLQRDDEMVNKEELRANTSTVPSIESLNPNWTGYDVQYGSGMIVDGRMIPGVPAWSGWQCGLMFMGVLALLRRSGPLVALREVLQKNVSTVVRYGTRVTRDAGLITKVEVAYAVRFSSDNPSPPNQNDPMEWVPGGFGLLIWTEPLYEWAALHSEDPVAKALAAEIVQWLHAARRVRIGNGYLNSDDGVQWSLR